MPLFGIRNNNIEHKEIMVKRFPKMDKPMGNRQIKLEISL